MALTRAYLERVKKETGLELSTIAARSGVRPETLTRPFNNPDYPTKISIATLRKVQAWSGIKMPKEMDPNPPAAVEMDDVTTGALILNALPQEGVKMTEAMRLNALKQIIEIVKKARR
jgi:hypothetical protein